MRRENTKFIACRCLLSSSKCITLQESWAITKMTTRCALYNMGALKIFESLWVRPRLRNFKCAFVPIDPMNVRTKFEVRRFIRSCNNKGQTLVAY